MLVFTTTIKKIYIYSIIFYSIISITLFNYYNFKFDY